MTSLLSKVLQKSAIKMESSKAEPQMRCVEKKGLFGNQFSK